MAQSPTTPPLGTTLEAAKLFNNHYSNSVYNQLTLALKNLLSKTNELVHHYLETLKQVGPTAFLAGLGLVGGTLSAVMVAPHVATLATSLVGLLQSSGALALTQSVLGCVSHCLGQAANLAALLGSSLLGLCPATANLGVAAAQAVGTSVVALLSALAAVVLAPAVVNSAKFVAHSVVKASNAVGHKVSGVVGSLRSQWHHNPKELDVSDTDEPAPTNETSSRSYSA